MRTDLIRPLVVVGLLTTIGLAALAQQPAPGKPAPTAATAPGQPATASHPSPSAATPGSAKPAVKPPVPAAKPADPAAKSPAPAAAPPHAPDVAANEPVHAAKAGSHGGSLDYMSMVFVFMLATFIGIGVIRRVSRLLHTPLMSLTNAISAIAVVGAIMVAGGMREYPVWIRTFGAIAVFCSMTNIISGFLITDRMLKMFKAEKKGGAA